MKENNRTSQLIALLPVAIIWISNAHGQTPATNAPSQSTPPPKVEETDKSWSYSASIYGYIVPDSREYIQPTLSVDHGKLHLEARYYYEDIETGSLWVGCNFGGGEKLAWELTPMLGGVFGHTTGVAPGYKGSLSWWKLELYSEGEFVVDTGNHENNFFYNWSELTVSPLSWFKVGLVTQRTRLYHTDREIQRGVLAGFMFPHVDFVTYLLNPDESKPTLVLSAAFHF